MPKPSEVHAAYNTSNLGLFRGFPIVIYDYFLLTSRGLAMVASMALLFGGEDYRPIIRRVLWLALAGGSGSGRHRIQPDGIACIAARCLGPAAVAATIRVEQSDTKPASHMRPSFRSRAGVPKPMSPRKRISAGLILMWSQTDLERAGIAPWAWVVNQSLAAARTRSPLLRRRAVNEREQIDAMAERHARRYAVVALQEAEPIGADRLRRLITAPGSRTG